MPAATPLNALDKAMKLLSIRALSSRELHSKLLRAGFPANEAEQAVAECVKRRFIDDALLAEDYTSLLRQRNTGSRLIRQKLIKRGLREELESEHLPGEEDTVQEIEAARRALDYKWRLLSKENDLRKKRDKAFRFLAGRGFPASLIFQLLSEKCRCPEDSVDY